MTSRRRFMIGSAAALGSLALGIGIVPGRRQLRGTLLSAFEDARGDQYIGGISLETRRVFGARVPARAHGCAVDPKDPQRALFFARRPGTSAYELLRDSMAVCTAFETPSGRHLAGHGVFSNDGDVLFTPEHDYERMRGVVAVRDARDFSVLAEIDTRGIDPHEVAWLPNGRSLLVANGGIMTHPRTYRRKLNIPTMDPSLCVIDVASGACKEQWRLPDHLLSIRHLAVATDATVAVGLQYEGNPDEAPGIVAVYRPVDGLRVLDVAAHERRRFRGYVASIALSESRNLIAAACPYGSGVACWTLDARRYVGFVAAAETYGLSRLVDGSVVASQRDGTAYQIDTDLLNPRELQIENRTSLRWDDHWITAS
jgi:hypothetical protein